MTGIPWVRTNGTLSQKCQFRVVDVHQRARPTLTVLYTLFSLVSIEGIISWESRQELSKSGKLCRPKIIYPLWIFKALTLSPWTIMRYLYLVSKLLIHMNTFQKTLSSPSNRTLECIRQSLLPPLKITKSTKQFAPPTTKLWQLYQRQRPTKSRVLE